MTFTDLDLSPRLLATVARAGYAHATPIQAQAIPHVLAGQTCWRRQTGTGKTAAFALPILQRLATHRIGPQPGPPPDPRPHPGPHARAGRPDRRELPRYGRHRACGTRSSSAASTRGRRSRPCAGRGHPGGHARPAAGPDRPAASTCPGGNPRPRRGRPHAGHGLHPRHPQGRRPGARAARRCCSRRPSGRHPQAFAEVFGQAGVDPSDDRKK